MSQPDNDSIALAFKAAGSAGVIAYLSRMAFKVFKADRRDIKIIDSEVKQLERLEAEIKLKGEKIRAMERKIGDLRNIELEGAPDIAVMGVHLEHLAQRPCKIAQEGNCPAELVCQSLIEVHSRINERRNRKAAILSRDETNETD